jgi:3-hydroxyisobutyrate dehydrogenase-like beta-hydroxyacid dehydrogenase
VKRHDSGDIAKFRVGVVGIGMIGGGIAQCLARRGRALSVYDVRPDAAASLPGPPSHASSPAELARDCDIVIIAVVDAGQARTVLNAPDGILAGAHSGLTLVVVSTVAVDVIHELAESARRHGVRLIDAGVTGGDQAATGGLVVLAGGDETLVEAIRPVLEEFSKLVLYMGPLGSGMATKIARNVITYGTWRIAYEAGMLAEKAGVSLHRLVQAVRTSDPQGRLATFWLERGSVAALPPEAVDAHRNASFVSGLLHKDLEAALALASHYGVSIPATAIALSGAAQTLGLEDST